MPEEEALFFLEVGVMIKKIREKASAFRTKKQQALAIKGQEKSPQSHQFWIADSILRLNSQSALDLKSDFSTHRSLNLINERRTTKRDCLLFNSVKEINPRLPLL